jgi:oxalate decarboxylase
MRLQPGGLRELHWHANAAEWAYMLAGQVRITVFDPWGHWETSDFGPGDVWYFPRGHGHSLQGIGTQESHFILGFDNGAFSEFGTFSITDWVAHTPPEVLAKNLGVPSTTFDNFPKREAYMVQGPVPPPLPDMPPAGSQKSGPLTHKYQLAAQQPQYFNGGFERRVSAKQFPISTTLTGVTMTLFPGGLRELHWHPNADEWQYFISGHARITTFGSSGRARTEEFGPGDVGYVPLGHGHYIENVGSEECHILIILSNGEYQSIFLTDWLASNPQQLVATNFGVPEDVVERFPKTGQQREP